jgi:hypothetical protein
MTKATIPARVRRSYSASASYRVRAACSAARSCRETVGDLAGLPLLMSPACPHCEQMSTRGSDAASVAPTWPQFGQTIRVSMFLIACGFATASPSAPALGWHRRQIPRPARATSAARAARCSKTRGDGAVCSCAHVMSVRVPFVTQARRNPQVFARRIASGIDDRDI